MSDLPTPPKPTGAYSVLAAGYDVVMEHVDYDLWAGHVHALLTDFAPDTKRILELGCGTGSFALALRHIAPFTYAATDGSERMVRVARAKAEMEGADIQFEAADFSNFRIEGEVDAVLLLYDGMNYLLDEEALAGLFNCTRSALRPGGVFIFDQSTPANSINNAAFFEDKGEAEGFAYVRHSKYDAGSRIHTTTFEIEAFDRRFVEEHKQRAYSSQEVRAAVQAAGLEVVAAFEDFGRRPARETSERIHWVVRRPADEHPRP